METLLKGPDSPSTPAPPGADAGTVDAALLEPRGAALLARWGLLPVALLMVATRTFLILPLRFSSEVAGAHAAASALLGGHAADAFARMAGRPGALVLATLPRLVASPLDDYAYAFAGMLAVIDAIAAYLVFRVVVSLSPTEGSGDRETTHRARGYLGALAYVATTTAVGSAVLQTFDLAVGALLAAAVLALSSPRRASRSLAPTGADLALGAAVALDVRVAALVPAYLVFVARPTDARAWPVRAARVLAPVLALAAVVTAVGGAGALLPAGPERAGAVAVESLHAAFVVLARASSGAEVAPGVVSDLRSLGGPGAAPFASLAAWLGPLLSLGAAAGSVAFLRRLLARGGHAPGADTRALVVVMACVALVVGAVWASSGASRLLWASPIAIAAAVSASGAPATFWAIVALHVLAGQSTMLARELEKLDKVAAVLLLVRYAAIGGVVAALVRAEPERIRQLPARARAWHAVTLVLFAVWLALATIGPVTANDVFSQMQVGWDTLQSGHTPTVEVYSATAAGRPFTAHEWLSGVVFYVLANSLGPAALSFLQGFAALACAATLYFGLPRELRKSALTIPLLALTFYTVAFRVMVRPHLLTMIFLGALVTSIESYRRTRSIWRLAWLVPLEIVWANLHGAFLLAPAMVGLLGGTAFLDVWIRRRIPSDGEAPYTLRHVAELAAVCVALILACLVNPYGLELLTFSVRFAAANEAIKSRVSEWDPTFMAKHLSAYWFWAYCALLAASVTCLVARIRALPLTDIALVAAFTLLAFKSHRFIAEFTVVAFPILVRSAWILSKGLVTERGYRPRRIVEMAALALLVVTTARYGYAYDASKHRPRGLGFGGDMPYEETDFIKAHDLSGVVFNEYSDGALIIFSLYPKVKPVIDSRLDIYGPDLMNEYIAAMTSTTALAAYLEKYKCTMVLLPLAPENRATFDALARSPGWTLALQSKRRFLFVANEAK